MKRIISIILAIVLLCFSSGLVACKSKKQREYEKEQAELIEQMEKSTKAFEDLKEATERLVRSSEDYKIIQEILDGKR